MEWNTCVCLMSAVCTAQYGAEYRVRHEDCTDICRHKRHSIDSVNFSCHFHENLSIRILSCDSIKQTTITSLVLDIVHWNYIIECNKSRTIKEPSCRRDVMTPRRDVWCEVVLVHVSPRISAANTKLIKLPFTHSNPAPRSAAKAVSTLSMMVNPIKPYNLDSSQCHT